MGCLDEETILGFCRGLLAEGARARAEDHISRCDECRQLVSAIARSSFVQVSDADAVSAGTEMLDAPGHLLRRLDPAMAATTPVGPPRSGAATPPVNAGDILAEKFEVERVLGAGGMGIVVAARHIHLGQRVALKFLLPSACEVPGAVVRFLREGKAAARITSEHVARVMDTGMLSIGAPYLVMEYLEGMDLGALTRQRGPLPVEEALDYVLQACEAIVEAHQLGIVHRDLKPANLFLTHRADGSPLVKVLDFGISKAAGSGSRSQLTSASVLMGSPRYMSPEQMMSAKDVDVRSDIWSLGVLTYELLTGKPVWEADTMQGLCALIASAPAPRLREILPEAPMVLDDAIARCLAKRVEDRVASVADLAEALAPIAPLSSRTSIDRILRVGRKDRHRAPSVRPDAPLLTPSPSTEAAILSIAGAQTGNAAVASDAVAQDARQGGSSRIAMILGVGVAAVLILGIAVNARIGRNPQDSRVEPGAAAPEPSAPIVAPPSIPPSPPTAIAPTASVASVAPPVAPPRGSAPVPAVPLKKIGRSSVIVAPSGLPPPVPVRAMAHESGATSPVEERPPAPERPSPPSSPNRALTDRK